MRLISPSLYNYMYIYFFMDVIDTLFAKFENEILWQVIHFTKIRIIRYRYFISSNNLYVIIQVLFIMYGFN